MKKLLPLLCLLVTAKATGQTFSQRIARNDSLRAVVLRNADSMFRGARDSLRIAFATKMDTSVYSTLMSRSEAQPIINSMSGRIAADSAARVGLANIVATLPSYSPGSNISITGGVISAIVSVPSDSVLFYSSSGRRTQRMKVWDGIITPAAIPATVDISSAGFTTITSVHLQAANNTTAVTSMPYAMLKSHTTSSVVFTILVTSSQTVGALGAVVSGAVAATNLAGMTVHVHVEGY